MPNFHFSTKSTNFVAMNALNAMKRMIKILVATWVAMGCALTMAGHTMLQPGVSLELAQFRAQHISNVKYDLRLSVPIERDSAVMGTVTLSFDWTGHTDLPIDFQGQLNEELIAVNNHRCAVNYADEHIIIPHKLLQAGRNQVTITFTSLDQALNRHADYLYTLFVPDHARSVFPCFDQPDLKARFTLTLNLPNSWSAISNAPQTDRHTRAQATDVIHYAESDPLPTYLFPFTAGRFEPYTATHDGRDITILYRESDTAKVAQLPQIAGEMAHAIQWMEQYTGITQPFAKYGTVVLPGYQFGGMEHPGCIQLRDRTIFLGPNPSPDERMKRLQLIAHETAHLWFGDLVTMRWFNDVWTKEVFANFMADKVCREQFPDLDHDLAFMRAHYIPAITTDRSLGTHPIQQPLANLNQAGLLYGNIIYHKRSAWASRSYSTGCRPICANLPMVTPHGTNSSRFSTGSRHRPASASLTSSGSSTRACRWSMSSWTTRHHCPTPTDATTCAIASPTVQRS